MLPRFGTIEIIDDITYKVMPEATPARSEVG
jgi:hypothetical protein